MKIAELMFFCPGWKGYIRYPIKKDMRTPWHEERIAEEGTKDFSLHYTEYDDED